VIGGVAGVFVTFALEVKLLLCVPKQKTKNKVLGDLENVGVDSLVSF
jgi:hypothetical protein